jgi:hypothetical protein
MARTTAGSEEVGAREGVVTEAADVAAAVAVARIRLYLEKAKKVRVHLISIIFKQFNRVVRKF